MMKHLSPLRIAAALAACLSLGAFGQQNVTQEGTSRAASRNAAAAPPSIDVQTGRILNEAIELMNAENHAAAQQKMGTLQLDRLSPYERGTVERILFTLAYAQDRYEQARTHLGNAIASGGLNAQQVDETRYQIAQLFIQEEKWREGAAALEEWFATTSTSPNSAAYYFLAAAYFRLEDLDRALAPAKKAVELMDPAKPNESWLAMLSSLHLEREEYGEAIPVLLQLIAAAPERTSYWTQLSSVYQQVDDYANALAITQLASSVGLLTDEADIRRLADLLAFGGVPYRGAQLLEAAIANGQVIPDDKALEKLASCWTLAAEFDRAVAPLQRAAELTATGDLFVRLGEVHVQRADWPAAIDAIERGVEKGGLRDLGNAHLMIGIAHYNQRQDDEAVPFFERAREAERYRQLADSYLAAIAARN